MHYELTLQNTAAGIGFFSTLPTEQLALPEAARYLVDHPYDSFIRNFMLEGAECLEPEELGGIIGGNLHAPKPFLAVLYEACIRDQRYRALTGRFQGVEPEDLAPHSPLVDIRAELLPDHFLHREWVSVFADNRDAHQPLPTPQGVGEDFPVDEEALREAQGRRWVGIEAVLEQADHSAATTPPRPPAEETFERAMQRLRELDVLTEQEMRHQGSLCPVALMHRWKLDVSVGNGRNDYKLTGLQTSWGKGLTLEASRASYAMEMVERVSSFTSVNASGLVGFACDYPLVQGGHVQMASQGITLDPNRVRLDVPYAGEKLWWLQGETPTGQGVWLPAQFVFLFCNLDEPGYFGGLGSTGLASGNTMIEARFAALLECLERDAEGTTLYTPRDCFRLSAADPQVTELLAKYGDKGVEVVFQDVTPEYGVPAYKAFVVGEDGVVAKGTAAHLSGRKAALSAMLEVTYPFLEGSPSAPAPDGLPVRRLEDLPDFSSGDYGRDLARLEALMAANGLDVYYVDLTHAQVGLPVAKAMVPGLELTADLDRWSRVSPRLFARYLRAVQSA